MNFYMKKYFDNAKCVVVITHLSMHTNALLSIMASILLTDARAIWIFSFLVLDSWAHRHGLGHNQPELSFKKMIHPFRILVDSTTTF